MTRVRTRCVTIGSMESLRGKLLIASPAIVDPHFRQTVVLLAEHTDEGAMGVVLNREADVTVGEAVPGARLPGRRRRRRRCTSAGPSSANAVTVLAQFTDPERAALLIDEDVGFVPAEAADGEDLSDGGAALTRLRRARRLGRRPARGRDGGGVVDRRGRRCREDLFTQDPDGAVGGGAAPQGRRRTR